MKKSVDKLVLNNYLRHVDVHNKIQEEREMWRQRELEKRSVYERPTRRRRGPQLARGRLVSDDFERDDFRADSPPLPSSYYWTRQLMKAEENDPFRWGHGGYKEMHPDEFVSSEDEEEGKVSGGSRERRAKRKSEKERKKKRRKCKDSEEESEEEEQRRKKSRKKKSRDRRNDSCKYDRRRRTKE